MKRSYCLAACIALSSFVFGQNVYVPEHKKAKDSTIWFDPSIQYIFSEMKDSVSLKQLKDKGNVYSSYLSKAPLQLKDFVFLNRNLTTFQTKKEKLQTGDYNFFNIYFATGEFNDEYEKGIYPPSLRYYADTNTITSDQRTGLITVNEKPILERYIEPFYFKNFEVTNKEYREFVNWVMDSIARKLLASAGVKNFILNEKEFLKTRDTNVVGAYPDPPPISWKKKIPWGSDDEEFRRILEEMIKPENERFYRKKEIDPRKLNYAYYPTAGEKKDDLDVYKMVINIYPDTMVWVNDFTYAFNEPMTDNYFWHPAYDNYPVVGLSWQQVKAYLHWKTKMMQQELDNKGIKYRVECRLPSEIEWEIAECSGIKNDSVKTYTYGAPYLWDDSWMTDLRFLMRDGGVDTLTRSNTLGGSTVKRSALRMKDLILNNEIFAGYFAADGSYHTYVADIRSIDKKKRGSLKSLNLDVLGISGMGGNVSEWMDNVKDESWSALFRKRQELLLRSGFPEAKLVSETEKFYYNFNYDPFHSKYDKRFKPNNARLVRGSNWFDERFSSQWNKNTAGINAKSFIEDTGYVTRCTIGFRYIIKVYPK